MHEITEKKPLLDVGGKLSEPGFAKSLLLEYDRERIKAARHRIKEWDYYLVSDGQTALALTIADNSYMGLDSVSLIDLKAPWEITRSEMQAFTFGSKKLPSTSATGDVSTKGKNHFISFKNDGGKRVLSFYMDKFGAGSIKGEIVCETCDDESMVIATPFRGNERSFYYNQKINCIPASGVISYNGGEYVFEKNKAFAVLDWGRGVWTYKNTWYWASASGLARDGVRFGFNLGYGFGDTSKATENMLFYGGKAHKLSNVTFNIPQKNGADDFMSKWTFTSDDGRFEMDFVPVIDRASKTDILVICSDQHQVFGRFSGKAVLDDGTEVTVKDFSGFAEKVRNKW